MTDTTTTESLAPTAPAAGIAEAGAALRASGWGEPAPEPTTEPTPAEAPAEPAEPTPTEGAFTQDESGKWHRPDGQFASAEEVAALDALPPEGEPEAEPAPEPIVVKLRARDGSETEIEVTDPKVADLLRANHNDGMRRDEFQRRMETVESKEAELREFETALRTNPEAVILQRLPAERQVSLAVALVAQHWDAIADRLVQFDTNPTERVKQAMDTQIAIRDQATTTEQAIQTARYAASVERAVSALVPESVDDSTRERFLADAASDLARAIQANGRQPVAVEQIPTLLAPRLALYRFEASPEVPAPAVPARPVARPLARPSAAPATAPTASVAVPNPSATVRRTVQAQKIAAAIAPSGAGAATVKAPLIPATATLTEATAAMKKLSSWGSIGS